MKFVGTKGNFLAIEDKAHYSYKKSKVVIQSAPYEHTSSYLAGSDKGPKAIIKASQFVEMYDEEVDMEAYSKVGICTLKPIEFGDKDVDKRAVDLIYQHTKQLLADNKFVVSLGAEHTVTFGFVKAFTEHFENLTILQIDAHSDLRESYHDNIWSHASVMARVHELGVNICQAGIRAQCKEEAALIKSSPRIHTVYAHEVKSNPDWIKELVGKMTDNVYITIDADGFDPSIIPAVGTAEPNGLSWMEGYTLLKETIRQKNVVGFDIVECAPVKGSILSEYTLAKLAYKMIGLWVEKNHKA